MIMRKNTINKLFTSYCLEYKPNGLLVIIILYGLFNIGCEDPEKTEPQVICDSNNTVHIPRLAKDLFLFNPGSWWIYKNKFSEERDTFFMERISVQSLNNNKVGQGYMVKTEKCYQNFTCYYRIAKLGFISFSGYFVKPNDQILPDKSEFYLLGYTKITDDGPHLMYYGDSLQSPFCAISKLDTVTTTFGTYSNIIKFLYPPNDILTFYTEGYYTPKIGLVKYTRYDQTEWELESYYIKP